MSAKIQASLIFAAALGHFPFHMQFSRYDVDCLWDFSLPAVIRHHDDSRYLMTVRINLTKNPAATCFPTPSPVQYPRPDKA